MLHHGRSGIYRELGGLGHLCGIEVVHVNGGGIAHGIGEHHGFNGVDAITHLIVDGRLVFPAKSRPGHHV